MALSIIVVAAGSGERLGSTRPKAFVDLAGKTLLERCLHAVASLNTPAHIVVVAPASWVEPARELSSRVIHSPHILSVVAGGASRTESVRRGLQATADGPGYLLIHDAARCETPTEVFERVISALEAGAAAVIPVLDVVDTVVTREPGSVLTGQAVNRDQLAITQTPQGFDAELLRAAYSEFAGDATDDAEVMRQAGHQVVSVPGHRSALKITYPEDLRAFEARLGGSESDIRVGVGVDVHRFEPGRPLIVGGQEFPSDQGLAGHSDGDVLLHAITDALLGAGGLGDLGTHFGTDRPEFDQASSEVFLRHALGLLTEAGFRPHSVSVQYIGNIPTLGSVRQHIGQQLSALVGAPVHVAATTTDGLGLTGRGEGAAAIAHALVVRQPGPAERAK